MSRAVAAAFTLLAALGAAHAGQIGTAHAADPAILGGGSGIVLNTKAEDNCTLTTIGHDSSGRLVGFTAAHCGTVGSEVSAEANLAAGVVGTFTSTNTDMDYAVITFDPDKVIPVNRVGSTTITGIGGPAQFPDIACKEGRTTGHTCGVTWGDPVQSKNATLTQICATFGDSGGPVVIGTTLVSMVNGSLYVPCLGPLVGVNITSVIADIDARGGVGAGFRPI
ncbi:serine protease [Nocardia sp. NPDC055053]